MHKYSRVKRLALLALLNTAELAQIPYLTTWWVFHRYVFTPHNNAFVCKPQTQVSKLFSKITELLEESDVLVFVLIDEIESLASARKVLLDEVHRQSVLIAEL